ncbi:MAG: DUF58 domain-containing protein [Prevotellaceae bacterium]|jgi:uncharacterized protein (DUF58 family)|nr:DUF58 domain-containing protein [Prevotellaceae bacterium]
MFAKQRLYVTLAAIALAFVVAMRSELVFSLAQVALAVLLVAFGYQIWALWGAKKGSVVCSRDCPERLSNGDENRIVLLLENRYPFAVEVEVIDEIPPVFQRRDLMFRLRLARGETRTVDYVLRPTQRGLYSFGCVHVLVSLARWGLLCRRFRTAGDFTAKVYPSFVHLRRYALAAASNSLTQPGNKKLRRVGQQLEPDQIKTYVEGDDYRTINWKATARRNALMVNVFNDERAQNLLCVIDKGRTMQAAFGGMMLLDYAINAALALAYVAMLKGDKAGALTFEKDLDSYLAPNRNALQLAHLQELLYAQTTTFAESDYSAPLQLLSEKLPNRALLLIFTNFDSVMAMNRQLKYLAMLARRHTVVTVFFEDSELEAFARKHPGTKVEIYETAIAQKLLFDKQLIISKLRRNNIIPLLTRPDQLTVEAINVYLEMKGRGEI